MNPKGPADKPVACFLSLNPWKIPCSQPQIAADHLLMNDQELQLLPFYVVTPVHPLSLQMRRMKTKSQIGITRILKVTRKQIKKIKNQI